MPAMIMILKIGKVTVPLPWFLLWLLALPLAVLGWLVGNIGLVFFPESYSMRAASLSPRVVMLLLSLHGLELKVDSSSENVLIQFI